MKEKPDTTTQFDCDKGEVVTIDITEINTNFMVKCSPKNSQVAFAGNQVLIRVGNSPGFIMVTLGFEFNGNGGSYKNMLSGSAGGSFNRRVLQPTSGLPAIRVYTFHVQ